MRCTKGPSAGWNIAATYRTGHNAAAAAAAGADQVNVQRCCREITDMRRLTTGIRSEKCVVRRFRRCANVIECTYTNLDSIAIWYSLLLLGYKPVQHVTVLNTVRNL